MGTSTWPAPDSSRELSESHWRLPPASVTPIDDVVLGLAGGQRPGVGEHLGGQGMSVGLDGDGGAGEDLMSVSRLQAVAEDPAGRLVVGVDVAELVEEHDALAQRGHHRLVPLLGGPPAGLGLACIGQLGAHHDPARRLGVVVDEGVDGDQDLDLRAVLAAVDPLAPLEDGGAVGAVGGDHGTDRHAGDFIFLPSVDGLGRLVPALDLPVGVDTDDGVGDVGHQAGPVAVGRFGRPALGDVPGDELVRGLPGPGGADAGDLHDDGRRRPG